MKIEVSVGEVLDKISILAIKLERIKDVNKLKNIKKEVNYLTSLPEVTEEMLSDELYSKLCSTNLLLWVIEDDIREFERFGEFNDLFIQLARDVYFTNDQRSEIKKQINIKYNSDFIEEKSYKQY